MNTPSEINMNQRAEPVRTTGGREEVDLKEVARKIRLLIIQMAYQTGRERRSHPGPALSIADIMAVLYFKIMNIDPQNPKWADRDRLILSKGHACPALYSALALRGFFSIDELKTLRHVNSILQGHPDMRKTAGVDMTAGSLGHGISVANGIALAGKFIDHKKYYIYVILGCGELQEGLIWEGAMFAGFRHLNNIIAFIDYNKFQSGGDTCKILSIEPIQPKWEAFGWHVLEIDGHDPSEILNAIQKAKNQHQAPTVIIAHTIKGKGVSFMENDNQWHQKDLSERQYQQAVRELEVF